MVSDTKMDTFSTKEKKISYFRKIQKELSLVSWTSKKELFLSTKIVLISIFSFGLAVYFADVTIRMFFSTISKFARLIAG